MASPAETVTKFKAAVKDGDHATARALLADRFSFRGPIDAFDAPEPYLAAIAKLGQIVERVDVRKVFADGNDVCLLYDMVTRPAGTVFIAEWATVENDQIVAIRVVFDPRPFTAMFANPQ